MPYAPLRSRGFCFTAVCAYIGRPPFFPLLIISSLYESDIGIAFNASSILIACTGTYSPLSRTPPPVNENNSLDVFRRVMESTGEDPYLNGLFCESMVKGFQGENLSDEYKIAACVKHFAGYGAPTAGRDYNTVELSEHTFREFYLPSYKAGIDAGAALVMTSFNTVNGIPATGNKKLMRGILRDEMGFDGVLISDWAAIEETI